MFPCEYTQTWWYLIYYDITVIHYVYINVPSCRVNAKYAALLLQSLSKVAIGICVWVYAICNKRWLTFKSHARGKH